MLLRSFLHSLYNKKIKLLTCQHIGFDNKIRLGQNERERESNINIYIFCVPVVVFWSIEIHEKHQRRISFVRLPVPRDSNKKEKKRKNLSCRLRAYKLMNVIKDSQQRDLFGLVQYVGDGMKRF